MVGCRPDEAGLGFTVAVPQMSVNGAASHRIPRQLRAEAGLEIRVMGRLDSGLAGALRFGLAPLRIGGLDVPWGVPIWAALLGS